MGRKRAPGSTTPQWVYTNDSIDWSCYGIGDGHGGLAENVYANDALWACWQAARAIQGAP